MTEELRPRRRHTRNRAPMIAAASTVIIAGISMAGLHAYQGSVTEDLEALIPAIQEDSAYGSVEASVFRENPVFNGPEWTAYSVMMEASTASDRLERAEEVLHRSGSVWLPWLSKRANDAVNAFLGNSQEALREAEFRTVYDQTKAACEAPSTGIETSTYIDTWTAVSHPEASEWSSPAVTPDHSQAVTAEAYKAAMNAGLEYLCPGT